MVVHASFSTGELLKSISSSYRFSLLILSKEYFQKLYQKLFLLLMFIINISVEHGVKSVIPATQETGRIVV
jgi:hypothetical protein